MTQHFITHRVDGRARQALMTLLLAMGLITRAFAADVPDFSLRSTTGQNVRLSEHRGEIVLLGFWARWCGDCRQAMQALNGLSEKYARAGVLTLGVNVGDTPEQAAAMSHTLGLTFANLVDADRSVGDQFTLNKMPLIVLIDRDGVLRFSHTGYERGDDQIVADQLRKLINE